jgi:hypothetical protein
MATGGAATGGAATGGAAAGAASGGAATAISVAKGFTGFEGDAQTALIRAIFGDATKGLTARDIYEISTPTTQCRRVIGPPSTCWICSRPFTRSYVEVLGGPQCEHILPITQAVMYMGLYSHKEYTLLKPAEKNEYLEFLRLEYGWAHADCNSMKKSNVYIHYNVETQKYEVSVDKINTLLSNILTIFPFKKLDKDDKEFFLNDRLTYITDNIFLPIVTHMNTRWADEDGNVIPAHGLDQLTAVVSLLTAPKTKAGTAATASANLDSTRGRSILSLPKDASALYDSIQRRTSNGRLTESIKSILKSNQSIKEKITELFRKIPFVAKNKTDMGEYIKSVGDYAIYLASEKPITTAFGRTVRSTDGESTYSDERIKTLQNISIIDTISAIAGTGEKDVKNIIIAAKSAEENPLSILSAVALQQSPVNTSLDKSNSSTRSSVTNADAGGDVPRRPYEEALAYIMTNVERAGSIYGSAANTSLDNSISSTGSSKFNVDDGDDADDGDKVPRRSHNQALASISARVEAGPVRNPAWKTIAEEHKKAGSPIGRSRRGGFRITRKRRTARRRRTIRR